MTKHCPYRIALEVLVGKKPPPWIRGNLAKFDEANHDRLVQWIGLHLQNGLQWATIHGVIDAVCLLVEQAKDNGNFSTAYDLEYRTDVEIAEQAELVLCTRHDAPDGWHPYKLHADVSLPRSAGRMARTGTEVYVQRKDGEVYLRLAPNGVSFKITIPCYLDGIDQPSTRGDVPTL